MGRSQIRYPFRRTHALAALLLLGGTQACAPVPGPGGPLRLVDDAGDTVALAAPARRVASLIPVSTELLFAIGAGPAVAGRTTWCDQPAEAVRVPSLGDGLEPNVEAILAVHPDLVVLYRSPKNAAAATRLRQLGVATIQLRTDNLEDLDRATRILGQASGHVAESLDLIRRTDSALAALDRRRDAGPRPTVLLLAWDQPPMTIGRGSFLHEIVERAGGRNLFGDLDSPSASVSLEAIAMRDPDVILTLDVAPSIASRPEWQAVRAVRERRFVRLTGTEFMRPSPRAPEAIRRLARALDSVQAR